jgi:hypothetical protein
MDTFQKITVRLKKDTAIEMEWQPMNYPAHGAGYLQQR